MTGKEVYRLRKIQKFTNTKIKARKVPSLSDVEEIRTNLLLEEIKGVLNAGHLGEYSNLVEKLILEDYSSLEVAAALLKMVMKEENKE